MIISGIQTGNTRWLAGHLQNAADNETIELAEVSGTVARDIDGALAEMDALCAGTNAKEGVYAAFINPPSPLTREQFMRALALLEERLGLQGQPRIVLFHIKHGRHHCHVVWSRIDIERMKAIHMSHDRQKLRQCAKEIAAEFGLQLPAGLREDRGAERFADPEREKRPTRAEKAQAKHSGITPEERRAAITAAWRNSDTAQAFHHALEDLGYMLAKGDKRTFVVVDMAGDVHSLARQIDGAKTKDVLKKLEGLDLALLPSVEKAKVLMLQRSAALQDAAREEIKRDAAAEAAQKTLIAAQRTRRQHVDLLWQTMKVRQMHERKVMIAYFMAQRQRILARRQWEAIGLAVYLKKIAFLRQLVEHYEQKTKRAQRSMEEQQQEIRNGMRRRHDNEAAELQRRYQAMVRLDKRELASLGQKNLAETRWWDPDGRMTQAIDASLKLRRVTDADFDGRAAHQNRTDYRAMRRSLSQEERSRDFLQNTHDITDDPASKWINLREKWVPVRVNAEDITKPITVWVRPDDPRALAAGTPTAKFKANAFDITAVFSRLTSFLGGPPKKPERPGRHGARPNITPTPPS
jgi:hypothetical protein